MSYIIRNLIKIKIINYLKSLTDDTYLDRLLPIVEYSNLNWNRPDDLEIGKMSTCIDIYDFRDCFLYNIKNWYKEDREYYNTKAKDDTEKRTDKKT